MNTFSLLAHFFDKCLRWYILSNNANTEGVTVKHWIQLKPKGRQVFIYGRHPTKPRGMRYVAAVPLTCPPGAVADQIKVGVADLPPPELEAMIERVSAFLAEREAANKKAWSELSLRSLASRIKEATGALLAGVRLPDDQSKDLYDQISILRGHLLRLQRGKPLTGSGAPIEAPKQAAAPKTVRARTASKVPAEAAEAVPVVAPSQDPAQAVPQVPAPAEAEPLMLNVGRVRPGLRDAVRGIVSSK